LPTPITAIFRLAMPHSPTLYQARL